MRRSALITFVLFAAATAGADLASDILKDAGVKGGLVVHVGCGDGALTAALRANDSYIVQGLDRDGAEVAAARKAIKAKGLYGVVSAGTFDGKSLPYGNNLVNLIVIDGQCGIGADEFERVLAPRGAVVFLGKPASRLRKALARSLTVVGGAGEGRVVYRKPVPSNIDEWTHYLHGPDGNPTADDEVVGPPRRLQWLGSPRWARHHDHMASVTSMVSAQGRVFYIFDEGPTASIQMPSQWRLIARDAFNGTILWKRKIDQWNTRQYPLKSGPAHLLRRLVAVGDKVYVTLGIDAPVVELDAATGETLKTYKDSEYTGEIVVSDGMVFATVANAKSPLPNFRRVSTHVWENSTRASRDWGWTGSVGRIVVYDARSGKQEWRADTPVAPCSLAVDDGAVVYHDGQKLVCRSQNDGAVRWEGEPTPAKLPIPSSTGPRTLIYKQVVLFAGHNGKMSGWSVKDGKKLWEQDHKPSGHRSLKDLFVVRGLAWTGAIAGGGKDAGTFTGYDPVTGEQKREFPIDIELNWFHHRCYPAKAAGKYILAARNGTEFVDLEEEHWDANHWIRGGCIYGVMPCNGLLYASMDACGCQLEAKLDGFKAIAAGPSAIPAKIDLSGKARLEKGPAYGKAGGPAASRLDWPTLRHDGGRSGSIKIKVSADDLKQSWKTKLGGRLSAITTAAGRLFVSSIDTHTVHALDEKTGKEQWTFTAGARVDSPPTYYKGLLLFGSADGYVYALRAEDGEVAWRFRAAPVDRRIMAWEQVESIWPVHGAVLVHDNVLYCTAGRNMYLDDGIRMIRLNPVTGELLSENVMSDKDPASDKSMHEAYVKPMRGNNMPVALSDVLSTDGKSVYMRSQKFGRDGKRQEIALKDVSEQPADGSHLFCQIGMLDDSYFFRSYWSYGRRVTGGYGFWMRAGRLIPSGRILCYDDENVYGFGRKPQYMVNASVLEYELFAAKKPVPSDDPVRKVSRDRNASQTSDWLARSAFSRGELNANEYHWTVDQPAFICRAMTLTSDKVFFAGPPSVINERRSFRNPDDPEVLAALDKQVDSYAGKLGGELWVVSKADGKVPVRYELASPPVFDGMIAAGNGLYIATVDGHILRLSQDGPDKVAMIKDKPKSIAWDVPEDAKAYIDAAAKRRAAEAARRKKQREAEKKKQREAREKTASRADSPE